MRNKRMDPQKDTRNVETKGKRSDYLQMCQIDCECHFIDMSFYFDVFCKNFCRVFSRLRRHRARVSLREA